MDCRKIFKDFSLIIKNLDSAKKDILLNSEDTSVRTHYIEKFVEEEKKVQIYVNKNKNKIISCINEINLS